VVPLVLAIHAPVVVVVAGLETPADVESVAGLERMAPIRQVLVAEMHEFPQGMPFLQFR
jgi:hypothetical protein